MCSILKSLSKDESEIPRRLKRSTCSQLKIIAISLMIPFVSGLFGLKSGKVCWDLLYRIGEEREICLTHTTLQEEKKNI